MIITKKKALSIVSSVQVARSVPELINLHEQYNILFDSDNTNETIVNMYKNSLEQKLDYLNILELKRKIN